MRKLYKKLPLFLQHILITIKNNHTYFQKFKAIPFIRPLKKIIKKLNTNTYLNDIDIVEKINGLIKNATTNVPYYIENKSKYPKLNNLSDIKNLPILKKEVLKSRNKDFISKLSNSSNSYFFKTSGSTGTPLKGAINLNELNTRFLVFLSSLKTANINYSKRVGRFLGAEIADMNTIYRTDYINKHYLFSIYHISEHTILKYHKVIVSKKIEIIEGYPSTIYSLVKLFKAKGLIINNVKHILTTAEKLLDHQKEEIELFFNCKVFDFYGSSEGSAYIYSYRNIYKNANKIGYIEVVDENYNPVELGILGRMLVTSFTSSFTPLIRYDIGDYCITSTKSTKKEILINEIIGRSEDVYITPKGIMFTRFSLCLKYLPESIIESQLQLKQRNEKVNLIYTSTIGEINNYTEFQNFEKKFKSMLGDYFIFEYTFIKKFEKKSRGKLRAVIISE